MSAKFGIPWAIRISIQFIQIPNHNPLWIAQNDDGQKCKVYVKKTLNEAFLIHFRGTSFAFGYFLGNKDFAYFDIKII
jgi:hypothetical protein